jgi:hypothetical protein
MSGFVSYVTGKYRTDGGSTTPGCMVLWFEDWKLDTQGKDRVFVFAGMLQYCRIGSCMRLKGMFVTIS